jgi:hypothetical protein
MSHIVINANHANNSFLKTSLIPHNITHSSIIINEGLECFWGFTVRLGFTVLLGFRVYSAFRV